MKETKMQIKKANQVFVLEFSSITHAANECRRPD